MVNASNPKVSKIKPHGNKMPIASSTVPDVVDTDHLRRVFEEKDNKLNMLKRLGIECQSRDSMIDSLCEIIQDNEKLHKFISTLKLKEFW